METSYLCALRRLKEERKRLKLTQLVLGGKIHISQGHYSKVESGGKRFTHGELKGLLEAGIDLHYVYRGERLRHPEYLDFFIRRGKRQAQCLAEASLSMIEHYMSMRQVENGELLQYRINNMKCVFNKNKQEDSCYFQLRRFREYSQKYMALILGLDVKKYASMEKCRNFGDSEVLQRMCDNFQVSPLLFLDDENGMFWEVCSLIEGLGEEGGRTLFSCLQTISRELKV